MSDSRILIHIGYPKCASSWLQQVMFADEKIGFLAPWGLPSHEAKKQFILPENSNFNVELVQNFFWAGLQEATRRNLVPVVSHEHLAGAISIGRGWKKETADKIYATFPKARILIIIREQKSILLSAYGQHIKTGYTSTIEQFLGTKTNPNNPSIELDFLKYDSLIQYYQTLFGNNNVLVLPLELLKKNQKAFSQTILNFSGTKGSISDKLPSKNVAWRGGKLLVKRQLNFFFPRYNKLAMQVTGKLSAGFNRMTPLIIHERIENHWQQFINHHVGDYFSQSNRKTSHLIGINLLDFGYD